MSYIGSTPTTQSFIAGTDYFNGNGSTVNFTLSRSVNSVNDIEVIVNNVEQIPSGYSVSGTTLTFSAAPSAGTSNVYVRYMSTTLLSIAPTQGSSMQFGIGSAALPSISFTGDTNTGIFSPAADTIAFSEGGVESMRIDSSGNVGIGITSPTRKLAVSGTWTNTGDYLMDSGSPQLAWSSGDLRFKSGGLSGTEVVRIDSSGRVTTPYQPMLSAYSTTSAYTAAVGSIIPFNIGQVNVGSSYNTSTYRFTAPVAGKYFATVWFLSRNNSGANCIGFYKNASQVQGRGGYVQGASGLEIQGGQTLIIDCAANDIIDARVTQVSSGDFFLLDLAGMQIYLIG